jgi:hypothetical protein
MHTLLFQPTVIGGNTTIGLPLSLRRSPNFEFEDPMNQNIVLGDQPFPNRNTFNTTFCTKLLEQAPSFSVFIRKVDKMKRRHSRRKTGKYETG